MRRCAGDQCIFNRRYEQHEYCKMAMAIFISRPNSHPFEERRVALTEPVKIGRSVAKSRPAANNCTFDCKVLSRNHAMLWYEGGKVRTHRDFHSHVFALDVVYYIFMSFTALRRISVDTCQVWNERLCFA